MKFQGSGFVIELPEGSLDASSYTFAFPDLGNFSPNLTVRFEAAESVDLDAHVAEVRQSLGSALEEFIVVGEVGVRTRGDWRYATHVVEWGASDTRIRQKQLFLWTPKPAPTLYTLTGTDLASGFERSEPVFDAIIRSFQPNEHNRLA